MESFESVVQELPSEQTERLAPYPEQIEVLDTIEAARGQGINRGYINRATGLGKTVIAAHDIAHFREQYPDARGLYLCHDSEILKQARKTFSSVLEDTSHGNLYSGQYDDQKDIVYATFQTMNSKQEGAKIYEYFDPEEFDYIVVDESHHGPAETYREVIEYFEPKFMLGLTSTPERRDQKDIKEIFGQELHTELLEDAIAKGYLARPDYRVLTDHVRRLQEIETNIETLTPAQLNQEIFVPRRDEEVAQMITEQLAELEDPRTIVFCNTIDQAERMAKLLGQPESAYHSKLHENTQEQRMRRFRNGDLGMLIAVDKLNEGVDVPETNAVVFLRSTESRTVWLQQLGRGLRKTSGKDSVLVLDFAASWERIQDVQNLHSSVRSAYSAKEHGGRADDQFKFEFSEEALRAIDVIRYARDKKNRPKPIKRKSRKEKWQQDEDEVKAMLGIDELPNQRLTNAEWQRYGERIAAGDQSVVEELLMRNLRNLYGRAKAFHASFGSNELILEDHFQHAVEGFYWGVNEYNPKKDELRDKIYFATYSRMKRRAQDSGLIRIPIHIQEKQARSDKYQKEAVDKLATDASEDEIANYVAEKTRIHIEELDWLNEITNTVGYESLLPLSAASQAKDNEPTNFDETLADETKQSLREALEDNLSYRERRVLERRYGLGGEHPDTLDNVGKTFNLTRERVRTIENQALKRLQQSDLSETLTGPPKTPVLMSDSPRERAIAHRLGFRALSLNPLRKLSPEEQFIRKEIIHNSRTYRNLQQLVANHG